MGAMAVQFMRHSALTQLKAFVTDAVLLQGPASKSIAATQKGFRHWR